MNALINSLVALGVLFLAFDLVVVRVVLRRRSRYRLSIAGAACLAAAALLLWLLPPGAAH